MGSTILFFAIALMVFLIPITAIIDVVGMKTQGNDKLIWVLIILFMPIIGSLLYFIIGRPKLRDNQF